MYELRKFIQREARETELEISRGYRQTVVDLPRMRFLEGKLEACKGFLEFLERLEERELLLRGSSSAFSPQG